MEGEAQVAIDGDIVAAAKGPGVSAESETPVTSALSSAAPAIEAPNATHPDHGEVDGDGINPASGTHALPANAIAATAAPVSVIPANATPAKPAPASKDSKETKAGLRDPAEIRRVLYTWAEDLQRKGTIDRATARGAFEHLSAHFAVSRETITEDVNLKQLIKPIAAEVATAVVAEARKKHRKQSGRESDESEDASDGESDSGDEDEDEEDKMRGGKKRRSTEKGKGKKGEASTRKSKSARTTSKSAKASNRSDPIRTVKSVKSAASAKSVKSTKSGKSGGRGTKEPVTESDQRLERMHKICKCLGWTATNYKGLPSAKDGSTDERLRGLEARLKKFCADKEVPTQGNGLPTQMQAREWKEEQDTRKDLALLGGIQNLGERKRPTLAQIRAVEASMNLPSENDDEDEDESQEITDVKHGESGSGGDSDDDEDSDDGSDDGSDESASDDEDDDDDDDDDEEEDDEDDDSE